MLERPKVVFNKKTGKYIMFAHLEERKGATAKSPKLEDILKERPNYRAAKIAIAVSDKVEGPYKFLRALRPNAGKYPVGWEGKLKAVRTLLDSKHPNWDDPDKALSLSSQIMDGHIFLRDFPNGQMSRDMTVFVDDDAKAYLITASEENATLHIHELTDDYLDFTGKFTRALVGRLNEAPAVFKKDGKYFMFTSYWHRLGAQPRDASAWRTPCSANGSRSAIPAAARASRRQNLPRSKGGHNFPLAKHIRYPRGGQKGRVHLRRRQVAAERRNRRPLHFPPRRMGKRTACHKVACLVGFVFLRQGALSVRNFCRFKSEQVKT